MHGVLIPEVERDVLTLEWGLYQWGSWVRGATEHKNIRSSAFNIGVWRQNPAFTVFAGGRMMEA
jgi:hypothetical protein